MGDVGGYGGYPAPTPAGADMRAPMQQSTSEQPRRKGVNKNLGAKDPLMKKAHGKVSTNDFNKENLAIPQAQRVFQLTVLTIVPFIVYVALLFVTTFTFYRSPGGVILASCIVGGACVMQYLLIKNCSKNRKGKWRMWIGIFAAIAAFAGYFVGVNIHYKYMLFYFKYKYMNKYSNVAASQEALQFEDAGSLLFTEGTKVDKTRAVGFRDIRHSTTLCVAPIVDGQMGTTDEIVFFAVGVNCCGWRASFQCDDAGTAGTRGGLLMLEPDQLVSPAMEWMVDEQFDFKSFEKAIALQKSVFAVSAAKHYRLLRWVKDPIAEIDHYRKRGVEAALISCLVFLLFAGGMVAYDVVQEARRQAAFAKALMRGSTGDFA